MTADPEDTEVSSYTDRLQRIQSASWKEHIRWMDPWGRHLRSLDPGYTLEIGCGIGRNLHFLGGHGVGIDHNNKSVELCRQRGYQAFIPDAFSAPGRSFDSLLFSHVLEHLTPPDAARLVERYLPWVVPGGKVIIITPQERGFSSDQSHITMVDFQRASELCVDLGLQVRSQRSFPLPRAFGRWFIYNEFVVVAST